MQVSKDFTTPVRTGPIPSRERSDDESNQTGRSRGAPLHNTVTPPESSSRAVLLSSNVKLEPQSPVPMSITRRVESPVSNHNKHVRFGTDSEQSADGSDDETDRAGKMGSNKAATPDDDGSTSPKQPPTNSSGSDSASQRNLISRRGGRAASPGRSIATSAKSSSSEQPVLQFKTFRSPPRKRNDTTSSTNDSIPNLCSTSSGLVSASSAEHKDISADVTSPSSASSASHGININIKTKAQESGQVESSPSSDWHNDHTKPQSISCDSSALDVTSPLASVDHDRKRRRGRAGDEAGEENNEGRLHLNSSPPPPSRDSLTERAQLTPARSPTGDFQTLPSLDDALKSPVNLFLSPHPPTPGKAFADKRYEDDEFDDPSKLNPKSPRTRDMERERFVATPTDFGVDFGKGHPNSGPFDSSNVLAWLQSPTANGLFSPGGFGSILNTPRAASSSIIGTHESRTPRTPNMSTSFFFSDVAGLPRSSDFVSPKPGEGGKKGSLRGYSNIICISPLASSKNRSGAQSSNTPINFKDVFASPNEKNRSRRLAALDETDGQGSRSLRLSEGRDPSLDSVHMAERDILEDKDLSVLMQLASTTPRSTGGRPAAVSTSGGSDVFRPPSIVKSGSSRDENLPGLQLPLIGGESDGHSARLTRKTHSRDPADSDSTFSNNGSNGGGGSVRGNGPLSKSSKNSSERKSASNSSSKGAMHPGCHPPYPMPPPYPPHPGSDVSYYSHLPPGMPPNGSMRVMVGAVPPPHPSKVSSGHAPRPGSPRNGSHPYPVGPGDTPYPPYPPPGHYHPGVPPHMHPPYHYPPHPSRGPPLPIYGTQHPHPPHVKSKLPKKKSSSKGTKRPLTSASNSSIKPVSVTKKPKGSSPPAQPKKKNKSPQLTDKTERQKAAATIQAVNAASGGKNDRAAALAAAILRGVTMRPSGKWQAQLYFAGKSRYIGVFDSREKAALAYEIAREKLKTEKIVADSEGGLTPKATEAAVNAARKAAFEGVNEHDPRHIS